MFSPRLVAGIKCKLVIEETRSRNFGFYEASTTTTSTWELEELLIEICSDSSSRHKTIIAK